MGGSAFSLRAAESDGISFKEAVLTRKYNVSLLMVFCGVLVTQSVKLKPSRVVKVTLCFTVHYLCFISTEHGKFRI